MIIIFVQMVKWKLERLGIFPKVTQMGLQMRLGINPFGFIVWAAQRERQELSWEGHEGTSEISEKPEAEK